jgi:hypothetical protein
VNAASLLRLTSRVVTRAINSEAVMSKRGGVGGWAAVVTAVAVLLPGPAAACDNPVFRYALERWQPDDFLIVAPASAQETLRQALDAVASRGPRPNLAVLDPAEAEQVGRRADPERMVLLAPPGGWQTGGFDEAWSGPPTAESLARITDSPARRELVKRLIAGEAIVWLVVTRGEADDDGRKRLDPLITEYIRDVVAMDKEQQDEPAADESDAPTVKPSDKAVFWPPRMSVLRVRADDPQERVFVAMLMASAEPEVAEAAAVFPVFGRGRSLGGIPLAKLDAEQFRSACDFLTGACSCEVKEMSPGSDLLLTADWNTVPMLIPRRDGEAFAEFEDESTGNTAHTERTEAEPNPTGHTSAAATAPAAGRATPPLAVWLAVAAGLLCCLAWLARTGR